MQTFQNSDSKKQLTEALKHNIIPYEELYVAFDHIHVTTAKSAR